MMVSFVPQPFVGRAPWAAADPLVGPLVGQTIVFCGLPTLCQPQSGAV
jgi:hypothetical protein